MSIWAIFIVELFMFCGIIKVLSQTKKLRGYFWSRRMFLVFLRAKILYLSMYAAIAICLAGGCSPAHYKADADKEVYNIIDKKW